MKKPTISNLFLYRHRYKIGYFLLALAFIFLLVALPSAAPNGLSEAEMESTVTSYHTSWSSIADGNLIDAPYHLLQKFSLNLLGLTPYGIKLPSIIIGALLGVLLILLLNRWFKNNVAIIASILTVLSSNFLYLAGSGTPLIMLVFWPTLLLWLGSKIQGATRPKPLYCFIFAFALLLAVFTPYMLYLVAFIVIYALLHPHLRFTIKSLPKLPFILSALFGLAGLGIIIYNLIAHPSEIPTLLWTSDFSIDHFFSNLSLGFAPFISWSGSVESTFLSPLVGLASFALAITGLISTAKGFFASRNSIASYFIIFTIFITGLNPNYAILLILPLSILIAHGVRYCLEKWYGLFPENPYARLFGLIPLSILLGLIIISDLSHFIAGYRYNPSVADQFQNDLVLVREHLEGSTLLISQGTLEFDFYSILEDTNFLDVESSIPSGAVSVSSLGRWPNPTNLTLNRIITSSKSSNSDRIYIYTVNN